MATIQKRADELKPPGPPEPPTLAEALELLDRFYNHPGTTLEGMAAIEKGISDLLDRACRAGMLK